MTLGTSKELNMEITRDHKVAAAQWLRGNTDLTVAAIGELLVVSERTTGRFLNDYYDGKIGKITKFFDTKTRTFITGEKAVEAEKAANYKLVVTNKTFTVIKNGVPRTADKTHRHHDDIKKAVDKKDYAAAYELITDKSGVKILAGGKVEVFEGNTVFNGVQVNSPIGRKIVDMVQEGRDDAAESFANFLVRVHANPDDNMVERLFAFTSYNDIKITKDGFVETYKVVRSDYKDCHSGSMLNKPGMTVTMDRSRVNASPDQTCSYGLHVCSIGYLNHFGGARSDGRIVLCKVDPADFVAVPRDYNSRKARVCKYDVIADVTGRGRQILGIDEVEEGASAVLQRDREMLKLENGSLSED